MNCLGCYNNSLSGVSLGGVSLDPDVIGKKVAGIVVPPVIKAVKAEIPGLVAGLQPLLVQQGNTLVTTLKPMLVQQAGALVQDLRPQVEQQARLAFTNLQPMLAQQASTFEKRLDTFVDKKLEDIASGAEITRLKRQAVVGLVIQAGIILGGMYLIEKYAGR